MTSLLVDLGNSRCKLAICDAGTISQVFIAGYDEHAAIDAYLEARAQGLPTLMGSVAGAETASAFVARIGRVSSAPVRPIRSTDPVPLVTSGYRKPEQLGVDRLLAMVAARAHVDGPCCVVDAGTAVTIDFVDAAGRHQGGFILPGQNMARDCLLANTSIPRDPEIEADARFGRDTATAVAMGARFAVAGLVALFVEQGDWASGDRPASVVVGGGDAAALADLLPDDCITLDHLVLRGLAVVEAGGRDVV